MSFIGYTYRTKRKIVWMMRAQGTQSNLLFRNLKSAVDKDYEYWVLQAYL